MRIYISADIEGVAGIAHIASTGPKRIEWEALGRSWMTGEALAAIEAAREAGAKDIVISDGHGSAHNLLVDEFPDYVSVVRSWPRPLLQMEGIDDGEYDAAIFIGHHAHATSAGGILSHTYTLTFRDIRLNGVSQSETTLNTLLAAQYGVPVIFTSGDDAYIEHCERMLPPLETVVTKRCHGYTSVTTLAPNLIRQRIRDGVAKAFASLADAKCMPIPDELVAELEFNTRSQAEILEYLPWLERSGPLTITIRPNTPAELMRIISFCSFYEPTGIPQYGW